MVQEKYPADSRMPTVAVIGSQPGIGLLLKDPSKTKTSPINDENPGIPMPAKNPMSTMLE